MLKRCATACLLAMLPLYASAATVIDVPIATGDFTSFKDSGDFLSFGSPATGQGFDVGSDLTADLQLNFNLAAPYSNASGFFSLADGSSTLLDGVLSRIVPSDSALSLMLTDVQGSLSSIFGNVLSIELTFFDDLGENPLASLTNGNSYEFSYVVEGISQPAPVPLPAGGLLLLSGFGLLAIRSRSNRAA